MRTPQLRTPRVPLDDVARHLLVVCEGGPLNQQAFFAGALADRARSALRVQTPHTPPAALRVTCYRATEQVREIKTRDGRMDAVVVQFRPITEVVAG